MIPKICEKCGKQFEVFPSRSRQRFCSRSCAKRGQHSSTRTEFTPRSLKKLWKDEDFRDKVLKARVSSIAFKNINKGRKMPEETRIKISESLKGEGNYWYGKHLSKETKMKISLARNRWWERIPPEERKFSEEHKRKISQALSGERNPMYGKPNPNKNWGKQLNDPEFQRKRLWGLTHGPTKPEKQIINLITKHSLPFKYVGDGQVIISRLIPDFIAVNGEKKIIEVFGDYWHRNDDPQDRINLFWNHGYDALVLWESEIKHSSEEELVDKVRAFSDGSVRMLDV